MKRLEKEFSQDWMLFTVLNHEPRLATLHELQTIYDMNDLYDFIEIIHASETIKEEKWKAAQANMPQTGR